MSQLEQWLCIIVITTRASHPLALAHHHYYEVQKIKFACENLYRLRTSIYLAQKVAEKLGRGKVLQ